MDENIRQRKKNHLLRVTMPNEKVICHKSATMTFIDALIEVGSQNFDKITLELCHLPLLSKKIYPRYEEWMKPVCDGWYVNVQSDTSQKYMQLVAINELLGLNMEVEIGDDFIVSDVKVTQKSKKRDAKLLVKLPNGIYIAGVNPIDTLIDTVEYIGPDVIKRKGLSYKDKPIITPIKMYNGQVQVGCDMWLTVPPTSKDKYKMLRIIDAMLRLGFEITLL